MLENYRGTIEVNGQIVDRLNLTTVSNNKGSVCIKLTPDNFIQKFHTDNPLVKSKDSNPSVKSEDGKEYRITVKAYMLKKAVPEFDFMAKMNNDNPMPLRTMVGKKIKETKGMEYWELHGEGRPVITCMRCGRELTNPISRKYGLGIECIRKVGFVFEVDDVDEIKEAMTILKWSGWIVKSAILKREEV